MEPFDYSLNIQRPDQALASGFNMGAQMRDMRVKAQEAEQRAQLQQAMQEFGAARNPAEKVAVMEKYPAFAKPIKDNWDAFDEATKKPVYDAGLQGYAALVGGNPTLAASSWRKTGEAFANSDRPDLAKAFIGLADIAEKDPKAADTMASSFLAVAGGSKFKEFGEAMGKGQDTAFQKDYAFIKRQFGQPAADLFANSKIDETAVVQLPEGKGFYVGPRSGMAAAMGGTTAPSAPPSGPRIGTIEDGYRFKGGNASDPASWEKVR